MIERISEMDTIRRIDDVQGFGSRSSDAAPLSIVRRTVVYRDDGRADYTVERVDAKNTLTGDDVQFHVASVKQGRPGAVCVAFAKGQEGLDRILLGRHWRVAVSSWQWEFPRGMGEADEDARSTAVRELSEETGIVLSVTCARVVQTIHADTGMLHDEVGVVALDCDCEDMPRQTHDYELSELYWVSVPVFEQMIGAGMIQDGLTLAAWTVVRAHGIISRRL